MDLLIFYKHGVNILALFSIITTLLTRTVCQDETMQFYANEDNAYDGDYDPLIIDAVDESYFSIPVVRREVIGNNSNPDSTARTSVRDMLKCDENQLMIYLAKLQVTNPESLLLIASYKDLEHLCRRIAGNLDSIDSFMQTCTPLPQDHLYMQLIAGLRVLSLQLCKESDYQKHYQNRLSCYHELHSEYIDCAGPADWTENMDHNELCNEYKIIADCYYTKTAMLCGLKAAGIMKELVVKVINGIIDTDCPGLRKNPDVENPMNESFFSKGFSILHNLNVVPIIITNIITRLV